jgi:DNA/RNA-binding domain of Phe-tRNA-synthetase-like protein
VDVSPGERIDKMIEVQIEPSIFDDYPSFRRGLVLAVGIQNRGHSSELEAMLDEALAKSAAEPIDVKTHPLLAVWSDAHRRFGSNPNKFPPAHAALLKRVQKGGVRLPFINKVVAIMNYNSIIDRIPVGGDDLVKAGNVLALRRARGSEVFVPLGSPEVRENPDPGEVIYVVEDSGEVMCRRWNWRNGHGTRITEETEMILMNIDGLGEESEKTAISTRDRVARLLEEHCRARTTVALLSPLRPSFSFEV